MLLVRFNIQKAVLLLVFGSFILIMVSFIKPAFHTAEIVTIKENVDSIEEEPLVDKRPPMTEDDLIEEIEKESPNLPVSFWKKHRNAGLKKNATCAHLPKVLDLQFNNIYWQTLVTSNGTFQLLNSYIDNRNQNKLGPTVRLIGMINRIEPNVTTYCQIWFEGEQSPLIIRSLDYEYMWRKEWIRYKKGEYEAYLISCNIPKKFTKIPTAVSLVERECDTATNLLKIRYNRPKTKKDFAVCVKGLDYPDVDLTVRLVEWIELLSILGNDMIYFYEFNLHKNMTKVLDYYQNQGKVQVTPFQLAGEQPNLPALRRYYIRNNLQRKRINEMVPYNDCFYQHMHEYRFIALLDLDEVILPNNVNTWQELLHEIQNKTKGDRESYSAQNLYFLDSIKHKHEWFTDIPKYMHMLQHVYRSVNFTIGQYVKSFFNTEKVRVLHNHYPISCLNDDCRMYDIELNLAQLQHYRSDCVNELQKQCSDIKNNSVMDTTIWKYKEPLIRRVRGTLVKLGFL